MNIIKINEKIVNVYLTELHQVSKIIDQLNDIWIMLSISKNKMQKVRWQNSYLKRINVIAR